MCCRVSLRYSNLVKLRLGSTVLIESNTGGYDAVLTCLDIPYLRQGFVPFNLEYASPPTATVSSSSKAAPMCVIFIKPVASFKEV